MSFEHYVSFLDVCIFYWPPKSALKFNLNVLIRILTFWFEIQICHGCSNPMKYDTFAISFFKISFLMMSLVAFFVLEKEKALLFEGEWDCKEDFWSFSISITVSISLTVSITVTVTVMLPTLDGDMDLGEREEEVLSSDFRFMKIDLGEAIRW